MADFKNEKEEETEVSGSMTVGRNAVMELLKSGRTVDKIFVKDGTWEGAIKDIVALARELKIPIVTAGKAKLDKLAPDMVHQGIIAFAAEKEYSTVDDILALAEKRGQAPFIVICDGINDPHNLGALIRCAEAAGCHGIIIPKRRSVTLTATVAKASAGAIEHMLVAKVTNLASAVEELKKKGVWIYCAEADGTDIDKTEIITPAAFVLGSEGQGVSRLIREKSDFVISIPMRGRVNSLNVSSAGAVILFHAARSFG